MEVSELIGLTKVFEAMTKFRIWWAVLIIGLFISCDNGKPKLDNPSRGTIVIAADESFKPLVTQLTSAYSGIYPDAHFKIVYRPEKEAINLMLQDSARVAFTTRTLTKGEQAVLDKSKIVGSATKLATDGVALIINQTNTDSLITMSELKNIFSGKIKNWSQLPGSSQSNPITLVFDNNNSSNLEFVLNTFGIRDVTNLRIFTTKSNREVIDFVRNNPSALGFIGVNWISDGDEPLTRELSKDLKVMGVSSKEKPTSRADYFQPFQEDLGMQRYPLRRPVYALSREAHPGLAGGLVNYVIRDAGSLIIYKLGLWPSVPYNREVNLRK